MRVRPVFLVLMLFVTALVASVLSPGGGAAGHETFVVEGKEFPDCTPPEFLCFDVVSGDLETDIHAGETIIVTLRAAGSGPAAAPHNINVINESDSDALHLDTDSGQALGGSSQVSPGLETSFQFEAPEEGTVLYFWCDIVEHEILGMWFTATVQAALPPEAPPVSNNTTGGPTTQNQTTDPENETSEPDNETTPAGNETVDETGNETVDGGNASVADSDEGAVEEDAAGPAWFVAVIAAAAVAWRARTRRA